MRNVVFAAVGAATMSFAGVSYAATVDFNDFAEGAVLGAGADLGNGIIADVTAIGGTDEAVVLSTAIGAIGSGNDPDLTSPFENSVTGEKRGFGNALIVQEDQTTQRNPTTGPDDNGAGGTLRFDFATDVILDRIFLLDVAEGTRVIARLNGDRVFRQVIDDTNESDTGNNANNNEFSMFDLNGVVADRLIVRFSDSGAIGEFEATAVPLPATLSLLAFGLLGSGYVARRRQK